MTILHYLRPMLAAVSLLVLAAAGTLATAIAQEEIAREEDDELGLRGRVAPQEEAPALWNLEVADAAAEEPASSEPRGRDRDEDPYAPIGVRIGTFIVLPSLELWTGYSDNVAQRSVAPRGGGYGRLVPGVEFRSDWNRHELRGRAAASYRTRSTAQDEAQITIDSELAGRVDIRTGLHADLRASYRRDPESRDDPNVPPGVDDDMDVERIRGEASITREIGRVGLTLRGAVQKNNYDDDAAIARMPRDYRSEEVGGRASYELVEGAALFVDSTLNRRRYDQPFSPAGPRRGSRGYKVLTGVEVRLTPVISGEAGIGYQRQTPDDPVLAVVDGPAFQGSLTWEPSALTTVTLSGALTAEEASIDPFVSGARVGRANLSVTHALRRNLIATLNLGYTRTSYVGAPQRETFRRAGLGLEYLMSREVALVAEASHQRFASSVPGSDYNETRVEVGVRVRR